MPTSNPAMNDPNLAVEQVFAVPMSVSCEVKCQKGLRQLNTVDRVFDSEQRGLVKGKGGLYAGLSTALNLFAADVCLANAERRCGAMSEVQNVRALNFQSADWKALWPISCNLDKPLASPLALGKAAGKSSLRSRSSREELSNFKLSNLNPDDSHCRLWLKANVCHGDCMEKSGSLGKWVPSLGAPKAKSANIKVCGDTFVDHMSIGPKMADDVLRLYCQQYFWNSALSLDSMREARQCAAMRGSVECGPAIEAMHTNVARK